MINIINSMDRQNNNINTDISIDVVNYIDLTNNKNKLDKENKINV